MVRARRHLLFGLFLVAGCGSPRPTTTTTGAASSGDEWTSRIVQNLPPDSRIEAVAVRSAPGENAGYWVLGNQILKEYPNQSASFLLRYDTLGTLTSSRVISVCNAWAYPCGYETIAADFDVSEDAITIVGTTALDSTSRADHLFVSRVDPRNGTSWTRVYGGIEKRDDQDELARYRSFSGRGIVRMPTTTEAARFAVLGQMGESAPGFDDDAAVLFFVDDKGRATAPAKVYHGRDQVRANALRLLPRSGLTIVGRTRRAPRNLDERWHGLLLHLDEEGHAIGGRAYRARQTALDLYDVTEGDAYLTAAATPIDTNRPLPTVLTIALDGTPVSRTDYVADLIGAEWGYGTLKGLARQGRNVVAVGSWQPGITFAAKPFVLSFPEGRPEAFDLHADHRGGNALGDSEFLAVAPGNKPDQVIAAGTKERVVRGVDPPSVIGLDGFVATTHVSVTASACAWTPQIVAEVDDLQAGWAAAEDEATLSVYVRPGDWSSVENLGPKALLQCDGSGDDPTGTSSAR